MDVCAKVINRFEGYIAQFLGDGLLVYFGYPVHTKTMPIVQSAQGLES
jgi:class 3 adenylate cyclase